MTWKWANLPVPIPHVAGIVLGAVLQVAFEHTMFRSPGWARGAGIVLLAGDVGLVVSSVLTAGDTKVDSPDRPVTTGPYSRSRNPMYVAWGLIHIGTGLVTNGWWLIAALPVVFAFIHFDVICEERFLEETFGDRYLQYKRRVRRYF